VELFLEDLSQPHRGAENSSRRPIEDLRIVANLRDVAHELGEGCVLFANSFLLQQDRKKNMSVFSTAQPIGEKTKLLSL